MENKEQQISEKAGNKVDDIHKERTDVKCVESNDNQEYERAQGSYSDRIKISEKSKKSEIKWNIAVIISRQNVKGFPHRLLLLKKIEEFYQISSCMFYMKNTPHRTGSFWCIENVFWKSKYNRVTYSNKSEIFVMNAKISCHIKMTWKNILTHHIQDRIYLWQMRTMF